MSDLEDSSDALAGVVAQRLAWFCRHAPAHLRFLNTLSLLEHIGSRKIMKSLSADSLGGDVLRHLAEETRHAYFFKHAAEKLAHRPLLYSASATIGGTAARSYMARLDAAITRECGTAASHLPYLYMSLIVELRAVWFYRLYQHVLSKHATGLSLKSVLAEEELHLSAMLARLTDMDPDCASRLARFKALEQERFRVLWDAIEAECRRDAVAAE